MKSTKINTNNKNADFKSPVEAAIVRGRFFNDLKDDFDENFSENGAATLDTITEKTADAGVTIEGIQLIDDGISPTANVIEKTVITTLTAAQIVGTSAGDVGHASGAILVASPGSDYVLELVSTILVYDFLTAAYTGGGDDNVIQLGTVTQTAAIAGADLLEASGDKIVMLTPLAAVDLPMTVGTTLNLQGTALTQPGAVEIFTLEMTVAEDTGGICTLTIDGVAHSIPLSADTVGVNALEIKAYIDANMTTHTATVLTDTVTVTSVALSADTNATFAQGTCNSSAATVVVTQGGVDGAAGVLRAHVTYRIHTTGL